MSKKIIIIKLGGSIISNKDLKLPVVNYPVIRHLAKQIYRIYKTNKYEIILIHGAGSFGHPIVKKHDLHNGMYHDRQRLAVAETELLLSKLNDIVVSELFTVGCPAIRLSPHSFLVQKSKNIKKIQTKIIEGYIKNNMIPVLFGDVVLDSENGCSIISGDTIMSLLAKQLKVDSVVFLSDVDGVYDKNPKTDQSAVKVLKINNDNYKQVLATLRSFNSSDVTGEMAGKLKSIKRLKKIHICIADGSKLNRLTDIVLERKPLGTMLFFD